MKRRTILLIALAVVVLCGGVWSAWRYAGLTGVSPVEGWIREYLVKVLRLHLNPQVDIGELDYEYPRTVVISQLRLTESDVDILNVKQVRLELAEIPRDGEPILIERVDLTAPAVQLVRSAGGGLIGWSNLLRAQTEPAAVPAEPGLRVSDFLRLRHAGIRDGSFAHRPANEQSEMILTGINADVETPPATDGPGWYRLIGTLTRDELFKISLDGRVDINSGDLVVSSLKMQGTLDESRYAMFPASLQDLLRAHQVQGRLAMDVSGEWSPSAVEKRQIELNARLEQTRFAQGSHVLTSERMNVTAKLKGTAVEASVSGDVLAGDVQAEFRSSLSEARPAELSVQLSHVDFAKLISFLPEAARRTLEPMHSSGRVSGKFDVTPPGTMAQLSVRGNAAIEPLSLQLLGSAAEAQRVDLSGTFAEGKLNLEVSADALLRGADRHVRSVRFKVTTDSAGTDLAAQFDAAGGHIQSNLRFSNEAPGDLQFTARLDRVRFEQAVRILESAPDNSSPPLLAGEVTGDLHGSWKSGKWNESSISGKLTLEAGQIHFLDVPLGASTDSMNIKYAGGRLNLDGRLNTAGGSISGKLSVELPQPRELTTSGKIESVSLATLLAAWGHTWNRSANGITMVDARVTGDFSLNIPMAEQRDIAGRVDVQATQAYFTAGTTRISLDNSRFNAELSNRVIAAQLYTNLLSGRAEVNATIDLDPQGQMGASWRVNDIQLENLSRPAAGARQGRYRGRLSGDGDIHVSRTRGTQSLNGRGRIEVRRGRLIELPVIQEILKLARPALSLVNPSDQDEATASFMIRPDCLESDGFEVSSPLMGIRGRGRVNYDGGLHLVVRATPAPRLTGLLGPLDKLLDDASGRLVTYRVDGTLQHPEIKVEPLGFSVHPRE